VRLDEERSDKLAALALGSINADIITFHNALSLMAGR